MSSQQGNNNMSGKNVCVITNVDSLLGYALAYRFCEAMQHQRQGQGQSQQQQQGQQQQGRGDPELQGQKLLCFVRENHASGIGLKKLEEMGAQVQEVNYKDEEKLRHHLKNVRSICLIPENSSDRLKEAECLIKACKRQEVEHFGLMSIVGVDRIQHGKSQEQQGQDDPFANDKTNIGEYRHLKQFCEIEKMVKEHFSGNKHCIVRSQLFNQFFYFLAPAIENENVLTLPVKKNQKWGTVNLVDVVEGIFCMAKKHHQEGRNSTGKNIYEFTASHSLSGEEMAREIGEGLGRQDQMKYKQVNSDEFMKCLEKMKQDKRFKERPHDAKGDFRQGRDGWWSLPMGQFLNHPAMELIMEYFCLANKGQLDHHTDDLKKVLGRNPHSLKDYFKINRECFKKFK